MYDIVLTAEPPSEEDEDDHRVDPVDDPGLPAREETEAATTITTTKKPAAAAATDKRVRNRLREKSYFQ